MSLLQLPRQTQAQRLSPSMMLAFSLLPLPVTDLREAVRKEVDANPALEYVPMRSSARAAGDGDKEGFLENVADERGETLDEHLVSELRMAGAAPRELELAAALAAELDGDGRFTGTFADLQMATGARADELEAVRQRLMTIEPCGCGARDLAECYRAQLAAVPSDRRGAVDDAIDVIAGALARQDAAAASSVPHDVLRLIQKLDPYPGRQYDHRRTEFIIPDVRVDEDGYVEVDRADIPEIRVSAKYAAMARDRTLDAETRTFATEHVQRAKAFQEALVHRMDTLEQIAGIAIARQKAYLKAGPRALVRQTMSSVARAAKCSISTVSRAAARKYVRTPRGIVPLRKFFTLVDQAPIEKLREILERAPNAPDRLIAEKMAAAGFGMARRTVAKYRARLGFSGGGRVA